MDSDHLHCVNCGGGAGLVAVLDAETLRNAGVPIVDLRKTAVRRASGITPGSPAENMAVAAAELLLDVATVPGACVLTLLETGQQLRMGRRPKGIEDMLGALTPAAQKQCFPFPGIRVVLTTFLIVLESGMVNWY